jgi:hypothetical protein
MSARITLILAFGALLIAACKQIPTPAPKNLTNTLESPTPTQLSTATTQLDPDIKEYAVYAALLDSIFANKNTKQVLIMDHTRVNIPEHLQQDLSNFQEYTPLTPELITSFLEHNQQPYPLKPVLDLKLEYQLLTQEEVDKLRPMDEASNWKLFYQKYPETVGFIHLSRVGFNDNVSQALVYFSQYHYEQPIIGGYYLMTRQDGRWEVDESMGWIT